MVRFASLFDVKERTVTFLGGKKYSVDTLRAMGAGDLLNSMFDFSEKLINLGLSEEEMSLFTAVVLVSAGGFEFTDWFLTLNFCSSVSRAGHQLVRMLVVRSLAPPVCMLMCPQATYSDGCATGV